MAAAKATNDMHVKKFKFIMAATTLAIDDFTACVKDIDDTLPEDFVEEPVLVFPNAENATVCILDVFAKSAQIWVKLFAIRNLAQHPCAVAAILRGLRKAGATVLATTQHGCARAIRGLFVYILVRILMPMPC